MKKNLILPLIALAGIFASCDDTTDEVGSSLTSPTDRLIVDYGTFNISSETVKLDNVISRSSIGYLGKLKDSETGSYITGNFIGQLQSMEGYEFPSRDSLVLTNGEIIADSCRLYVYYSTYTGDSTVSMKCKLHEMAKPLSEAETYSVDFKPTYENGYLRENGMTKSTTYSLIDYSISDTARWAGTYRYFNICLDNEYTDVDGNKYNNYGTYIMRKYYEPGGSEKFKNSYNFIHNICPGFYLEHTGGIGCMANIALTQLIVYFRDIKADTIHKNIVLFGGTEEVLQKTNLTQDNAVIEKLKDEGDHTYLKTPAGLYTQVTLPVDQVFNGHENDTLNTARVTFIRENNSQETNSYTIPVPQQVMIIPADSVETFFAEDKVTDNRSSYLTSYSSSANGYTFNNISGMMSIMKEAKTKYLAEHRGTTEAQYEELHPRWNKAIIIPVITSSIQTDSYGSKKITRVVHDMSISSTKLVGGKDNPEVIKMSCIYSKFQK